jgi:hypothetical protein
MVNIQFLRAFEKCPSHGPPLDSVRPLRARREWPSDRAAERSDEFAPSNGGASVPENGRQMWNRLASSGPPVPGTPVDQVGDRGSTGAQRPGADRPPPVEAARRGLGSRWCVPRQTFRDNHVVQRVLR